MKRGQIYKNKSTGVYAVADEHGNYSINTDCDVDHGFTDFRQDGSWVRVAYDKAPAWVKDQINEFNLSETIKKIGRLLATRERIKKNEGATNLQAGARIRPR